MLSEGGETKAHTHTHTHKTRETKPALMNTTVVSMTDKFELRSVYWIMILI